jgi:hypothetical protein
MLVLQPWLLTGDKKECGEILWKIYQEFLIRYSPIPVLVSCVEHIPDILGQKNVLKIARQNLTLFSAQS